MRIVSRAKASRFSPVSPIRRSRGPYSLNGERISSGIDALDEMLSEGYWPGASTLIAGPSGCGKTLLGLHFIFGGARDGEPGLIATLQENPSQLERVVRSFDWSLEEDAVEVMYRSPVDIYIDQWFYELLERVERGRVRRVLIDSLDDLGFTTQDEVRFREYMYSLVQRCARNQVSLMMTLEVPDPLADHASLRFQHLAFGGQCRPPPVRLVRSGCEARAHGAESPRERARADRARVQDHGCGSRPGRGAGARPRLVGARERFAHCSASGASMNGGPSMRGCPAVA